MQALLPMMMVCYFLVELDMDGTIWMRLNNMSPSSLSGWIATENTCHSLTALQAIICWEDDIGSSLENMIN